MPPPEKAYTPIRVAKAKTVPVWLGALQRRAPPLHPARGIPMLRSIVRPLACACWWAGRVGVRARQRGISDARDINAGLARHLHSRDTDAQKHRSPARLAWGLQLRLVWSRRARAGARRPYRCNSPSRPGRLLGCSPASPTVSGAACTAGSVGTFIAAESGASDFAGKYRCLEKRSPVQRGPRCSRDTSRSARYAARACVLASTRVANDPLPGEGGRRASARTTQARADGVPDMFRRCAITRSSVFAKGVAPALPREVAFADAQVSRRAQPGTDLRFFDAATNF